MRVLGVYPAPGPRRRAENGHFWRFRKIVPGAAKMNIPNNENRRGPPLLIFTFRVFILAALGTILRKKPKTGIFGRLAARGTTVEAKKGQKRCFWPSAATRPKAAQWPTNAFSRFGPKMGPNAKNAFVGHSGPLAHMAQNNVLGPKTRFGPKTFEFWAQNLGPKFGTQFLGPKFWAPKFWGPKLGPRILGAI